MNKKNVYILEDRGVLFVHGKDTKEFLQNLITNDINKVNETNSCFASLLTPQGKYLFDFLIVEHKKGYFLDCEKKQIEELYKQSDKHQLLLDKNIHTQVKLDHIEVQLEKALSDIEKLKDKVRQNGNSH